MKVYYYIGNNNLLLVGEIITNQSLDLDRALELLEFDEEEFCREHNLTGIDYEDFTIVYK